MLEGSLQRSADGALDVSRGEHVLRDNEPRRILEPHRELHPIGFVAFPDEEGGREPATDPFAARAGPGARRAPPSCAARRHQLTTSRSITTVSFSIPGSPVYSQNSSAAQISPRSHLTGVHAGSR